MRPQTGEGSPAQSVSAPPRPPILALVAISALSPFAINVIVPAMPELQRVFSTSYSHVQLTLSLFLASVAISQIVIGPLSDRFGRRPVLLIGLSCFTLACVVAAFATSVEALIGLRIVQGATGCVGLVLGRAIVRDLFERRQAASMIGYITMGYALAPMVAPFIGGLLLEGFGWQAIFWFMAGFGLTCIAVVYRFIAETNLRPTPKISFGTLFADYRRLVRDGDFVLFTMAASFGSGFFFAFLGGAPYVSEHILGLSPIRYGMWFGLIALGYSTGNFLSGRFAERIGVTRMILAGSIIAVVASTIPPALFALGYGSAAALFVPMMLTGISNGIVLPNAIAGAISVRPEIAGAAAGLSGAVQIGCGAGMSALAGILLEGGETAFPLFAVGAATAAIALGVAVLILMKARRSDAAG
jgi:MFS transporter, DHA1 family, multidrug resistance protein